jgi:hypothetical protein
LLTRQRTPRFVLLTLALLLTLPYGVSGQEKSKKKKAPPTGTPVLWRDPGDISTRNLLLGAGGEEMKPDISNVTFIKDEVGGYSAGFRVRDGAGNIWVAKLGKEAQPETAASRFV